MFKVKFYGKTNKKLLEFAVIVSRSDGKWVFCKQKNRNTYECPGGHRDEGEDILETAKRELYEETGAIEFTITQICTYSIYGYDGLEIMKRKLLDFFAMQILRNLESFQTWKLKKFNCLKSSQVIGLIQKFN